MVEVPHQAPGVAGIPGFERWTPPDFSDLELVARALEVACPEARPVGPLSVLGEGYFSVAVVTASRMVFRLGTSPDVFARYRKEWRVLPWLGGIGLPLETPRPRWLLEPGGAFPFGGIGYPLLEGRAMTAEDAAGPHRGRFVEQIAEFNFALHRAPVAEAFALGVPDGAALDRRWDENDRRVTLVALEGVLEPEEYATVVRWWESFFGSFSFEVRPPVFKHGDIGDDNLLVGPSGDRLVGVVDFEHCAVGDLLDDFRSLQYLDRPFFFETVAAYERLGGRVYEGFADRLEWHWQRGAFPAIRRAWQRGEPIDAEAVRASLREHRVLPSA